MDIRFKIDVETLLKHNSRETLETVIPRELHIYETHELSYGKETHNG